MRFFFVVAALCLIVGCNASIGGNDTPDILGAWYVPASLVPCYNVGDTVEGEQVYAPAYVVVMWEADTSGQFPWAAYYADDIQPPLPTGPNNSVLVELPNATDRKIPYGFFPDATNGNATGAMDACAWHDWDGRYAYELAFPTYQPAPEEEDEPSEVQVLLN